MKAKHEESRSIATLPYMERSSLKRLPKCRVKIKHAPFTSSRGTLRFSGNKIRCSPRDQSLSVNYDKQKGFQTIRLVTHIVSAYTEKLKNLSISSAFDP